MMRELPRVTMGDLLERAPCYDEDKIEAIAHPYRRSHWTALEVLSLDEVPAEDRLWVVLDTSMLPSVVMRRFAVEVAADVMRLTRHSDVRSWRALDAAMAFEREEIDSAARAAARAAAGAAARVAAWVAASADAGADAGAAQIKMLRQIILRWCADEDIAAGGPWKRPERQAA